MQQAPSLAASAQAFTVPALAALAAPLFLSPPDAAAAAAGSRAASSARTVARDSGDRAPLLDALASAAGKWLAAKAPSALAGACGDVAEVIEKTLRAAAGDTGCVPRPTGSLSLPSCKSTPRQINTHPLGR